jgi:hypothetical protein
MELVRVRVSNSIRMRLGRGRTIRVSGQEGSNRDRGKIDKKNPITQMQKEIMQTPNLRIKQ